MSQRMTLMKRIEDGHTDLVFEYVAEGKTEGIQDGWLLNICAYYGDVSAIKYLLANGAPLAKLLAGGPLNNAAFHGHWRLCQFLIENGADVNERASETGETPLHSALTHPNRPAFDKVVEVLLANGADPNVVTNVGAPTGAFVHDARTKGETPLHRAAAFGTEHSVQLLLDAGAIVDVKDANGDSPLAWGSWYERPGTVLRKLCYGRFFLGPPNLDSDHGRGWGKLELRLLGEPHVRK